jgi:predicted ATPase/DNA-binding SARP family transcriptional activator
VPRPLKSGHAAGIAGRVPVEAPRPLEIGLLGGFRVLVGAQAVPDTVWRQKRAAAIVKLLALEPAHVQLREQIIDTLWPELDPDAAANNLRVALHHARQGLQAIGATPGTFLSRDGDAISLGPPELVSVDIDRFMAAVKRAWNSPDPEATKAALDRYGGDLLPEDLYEDWASGQRTALRASYRTLLRRLAQVHEQRDEIGQAIAAQQQLLTLEPLDEETHAALIRLFALAGQQQQAQEHYDHLVALFARELDSEPLPATRALIASIREGRFPETALPLEPASATGSAPAATRPRGLPAPVDDLIGREREVAELRHLLATTRLMTLTGPGGVGKTRLALAAAHVAAPSFAGNVAFADLSEIDDPALALPAIARAMGVRETGGQPMLDTLSDAIGSDRWLLVIDNMEHVADAAAQVAALLATCPHLVTLVTSRSRLQLMGEQEYPVQPLAVPDVSSAISNWDGLALPGMALEDVPAVALFTRRAQAARPDFTLDGPNGTAVAEICRRLEGLPLAIELAAARVRLLPPADLLAQLEHPLAVLTGGPRDAPARHRTLRATIGWSYDLLPSEEQDLFARLSVFAGGCTLGAIDVLLHDPGHGSVSRSGRFRPEQWSITSNPATLDLVASLVEQSLLRQETDAEGVSRLRMLETIREYARERLEFTGEADDVRHHHADLFQSLAEAAEPELTGPEQAIWLEWLESEHDNLRQAITTWHEREDGENELRLAAALWRFWWQRGFLTEGRYWLEQALGGEHGGGSAARGTAHDGAGALAEAQGDLNAAALHHEAALDLRRALGDRGGEARSMIDFGIIADKMGNPERAVQLFEDGLAIAREVGDRAQLASGLANLGFTSLDQGNHQHAAAAFRESLALFRELEDQRNLCYVLGGLGNLAFLQGDLANARAMQEESLNVLRSLGDRQGIADATADLGHVLQRQGDLAQAETLYGEALHHYQELGDRSGITFVLTHLGRLMHLRGDSARAEMLLQQGMQAAWQLGEQPMLAEAIEGLAEVACDGGEPTRCARLLGAAEALRESTGVPLPAVHEPAIAQCVSIARAALGDAGFAAARAEGRTLQPEQTLAALAEISGI